MNKPIGGQRYRQDRYENSPANHCIQALFSQPQLRLRKSRVLANVATQTSTFGIKPNIIPHGVNRLF